MQATLEGHGDVSRPLTALNASPGMAFDSEVRATWIQAAGGHRARSRGAMRTIAPAMCRQTQSGGQARQSAPPSRPRQIMAGRVEVHISGCKSTRGVLFEGRKRVTHVALQVRRRRCRALGARPARSGSRPRGAGVPPSAQI